MRARRRSNRFDGWTRNCRQPQHPPRRSLPATAAPTMLVIFIVTPHTTRPMHRGVAMRSDLVFSIHKTVPLSLENYLSRNALRFRAFVANEGFDGLCRRFHLRGVASACDQLNTRSIFPVIWIRTKRQIGKIFLNSLQTCGNLSFTDARLHGLGMDDRAALQPAVRCLPASRA